MNKEHDVLICGGGVSGLYFAWRLLSSDHFAEQRANGKVPRVTLVELSNRIGGRIETAELDAELDLRVELGAMRYLSNHKLVQHVVSKLGLPTLPFLETSHKSYYLRGRHFSRSEIARDSRQSYNLRSDEGGLNPEELLKLALGRLRKKGESPMGFANALKGVISHEAFQFLKDSNGYDSNFANGHTVELAQSLDENFTQSHMGHKLRGGMSQLTERLAAEVMKLGGSIYLNTRVVGFDKTQESGAKPRLDVFLKTGGGHEVKKVTAQHLVLAMPQYSINKISERSPPLFAADVREAIDSVESQSAFKLFLSYDECWWSEEKFGSDGLVISDLPLRMNYHKKIGKKSLVMVYADMDADSYWHNLCPKDYSALTILGGQRASATLVETVQAQLAEIYGAKNIPMPRQSLFRDWSRDPFGGGYHVWRPQGNRADLANRIRKPVSDLPLFVCGEAFSSCQSWIEGALRSAESLLQDYFEVAPEVDFPRGYSLGHFQTGKKAA